MRAGTGTLLNFTLKFGEKNLSDYLEEIVAPAFLNNYVRTVGKKTRFLFLGVEKVDFGNSIAGSDPAIIGQFVKDTVLESTQVLEGQKLIDQNAKLRSSPSATFALFLKDHKLFYFADAPHAPDFSSFKSTALNFVKRQRKVFIDSEYNRLKKTASKSVTKTRLNELNKIPTLNILPIPNQESARKFVQSFEKIQSITLKVIEGNDEGQASRFLKDLKGVGDDLGADATARFNNKEGLDKPETSTLIAEAAENGVSSLKVTGKGENGERLVKTSEDLSVEVELTPLPPTKRAKIRGLLKSFKDLGLRE